MKRETKEVIVGVGSMVMSCGTSVLLGWIAGWGATALVNHVFPDGLTRAQIKLLTTVTCAGASGIAFLTYNEMYPKVAGYLEDVMDLFSTDPKEVKDVE